MLSLALTVPLATTASSDPLIPIVGSDVVGLSVEVVGNNLVTGIGTNRTIRLVATVPTGWRLDAVAGNLDTPLTVQAVDGTFYQHAFGGNTSLDINDGLIPIFPELAYDSWTTIGAYNQSGEPYSEPNAVNTLGIDWSTFDTQHFISSTNGTWYVTPEDIQGTTAPFVGPCDRIRDGVAIAQLTLVGDNASLSFSALLQGKDNLNQPWQRHIDSIVIGTDNTSPVDVMQGCDFDLTDDDTINVTDLLELLTNWSDPCMDFDFDSDTGASDLVLLLAQWGPCPTS